MTHTTGYSVSSQVRLFPEAKWNEIAESLGAAFRMDEAELARFKAGKVARLIAAIPFLAGCDDAERTAVAHLGTYLLSTRETKPYFNARPEDNGSVFERLRLISNFKGGDQRIIERGMSLLALNMVTDYRRDAAEDVFLRKYNPVSDGEFEYDGTADALRRTVEAVDCPEMEQILSASVAPLSFWGY